MTLKRTFIVGMAVVLVSGASFSYANDKKNAKAEETAAGWNDSEMQQPATETLDRMPTT